jgi:large conductance mechanosensitive channel
VAPTLAAVKAAGVPVLAYGSFISVLINFIILAFIIFMMVRQVSKLTKALIKEEEAAPAAPAPTPEDILLLREIRDSLKK